jgi:IQ calmodulin-binding motif
VARSDLTKLLKGKPILTSYLLLKLLQQNSERRVFLMKRKGKQHKPVKNAFQQEIPLNLDLCIPPSAFQVIPSNQLSLYLPLFGLLPVQNATNNMFSSMPSNMHNARHHDITGHHIPHLRTPDQSHQTNAAITIQKHYRGYLIRKTYISNLLNPIIKQNHPDLYQRESIIYKVIQGFIVDCVVEICLVSYHPVRVWLIDR